MKKVLYLILILVTFLVLPFGVFAEGEEEETEVVEDRQVVVYFFRGEGCAHCAEAEAWFESIEEELGDKFRIEDYETWYNESNANLMERVAEARGESDNIGVPYIIIGDQSWIGFDDSLTGEMIDKINEMYEFDINDRYDIKNYIDFSATEPVEEKHSVVTDIIALVIILVIAGGVGTGIYFARKANNE